MKKLFNLTVLFFLTAFIACTNRKQDIKTKDFSVTVKSLKADTLISSALYYNGYILCLREDHKLFVLDTTLNLADSLTSEFSGINIRFLHSYNDTIILSTNKDIFFLDKDFVLKKFNAKPLKYGIPYYNDSIYHIYACSVGEWGGAVFFWNQKTNKTFSYPATSVQQVLKFKGNYIVSSFLAHLSGFSDYLSIKDPEKLYELKDEKQKTYCNWYMEVDSIKNKKLTDTLTPPGTKYYADEFTTRTMVMFPYKDSLYSIYCTDSATILAKHVNFKLIPIDTLLKKKIIFHSSAIHLTNNVVVTAYRASWATSDARNKMINYQNTGLIFIKDNRIRFLEFETPHMWTKRNSQ
jgi:hypothetical protein